MPRPEALVALASLLLGTICADSASAHGLEQREALVAVEADRIVTTIAVDAGSEAAIQRELVIRDGDGRRLAGRIVSAAPAGDAGHLMVRIEHALDHPARWLSFQLAQNEAAPRTRRLALIVLGGGGDGVAAGQPRHITLTSGGNVETLRFGGAEPDETCGPALLDRHPERMQSPQALLREEARGSRLDVVLPLGLLETWLPLARADRDGISEAEQAQARAAILDLVAGRVRMVAEGREVRPVAGEVAFLGLDDAAVDAAPEPRRLDAWTARVRVSLRFDRAGSFEWDLWNARVTTASVVVMHAPACARRRISTYEPRL